ncbi:peptide-methionine (S)-S-oxide reductase [Pedobacter sp. UYP30]
MTLKKDFREILAYFYRIHNPSTIDKKANDRGSSYHSAIFIGHNR